MFKFISSIKRIFKKETCPERSGSMEVAAFVHAPILTVADLKNLKYGDVLECIKGESQVYTGAYQEHDSATCSDCSNGRWCQYPTRREREFIKLGYFHFPAGRKYSIERIRENYIRLACTTEPNIVYDLNPEKHHALFKVYPYSKADPSLLKL